MRLQHIAEDICNRILVNGWHTWFRQRGGELVMFTVKRRDFLGHLKHLENHIAAGGEWFMDGDKVTYTTCDDTIHFPCGETPLWNLYQQMGGR